MTTTSAEVRSDLDQLDSRRSELHARIIQLRAEHTAAVRDALRAGRQPPAPPVELGQALATLDGLDSTEPAMREVLDAAEREARKRQADAILAGWREQVAAEQQASRRALVLALALAEQLAADGHPINPAAAAQVAIRAARASGHGSRPCCADRQWGVASELEAQGIAPDEARRQAVAVLREQPALDRSDLAAAAARCRATLDMEPSAEQPQPRRRATK